MTIADLKSRLLNLALENDYEEQRSAIDRNDPDFEDIIYMLLEELLPKVYDDWSKVEFSTENVGVEKFDVTDTGVPYVLLWCGGDWETPIAAVIYFDDKGFRGYVPKKGNSYNLKTKKAHGNHDEDDYVDVEPDWAIVRDDINLRIQARGVASAVSKPAKSKAKVKAEQQAQIESTLDLSGPLTKDMLYAVINLAAGSSYIELVFRASGRELNAEECDRVVGMPLNFRKTEMSGGYRLWYAPDGCYPMRAWEILQRAGWEKAPDNDISMYANARTQVIYI